MKNIDQDFDLIQRYLDGALDTDQQTTVEKRLQKEKDFAQLYNQSKTAVQIIQDDAEQATMALLQKLHRKEVAEPKLRKKDNVWRLTPRRLISIAATIGLVLVAGFYLFRPTDPSLSAFNNYYETPTYDLQRGGEPSLETSEIISAYNNQDFETALAKIAEYEQDGTTNLDLQIYKAVCFLELGNTQSAIDQLTTLTQQEEHLDEIYWLLAMAHLKNKDIDAASQNLQILQGDDFSVTLARKLKAQNILEELER